MTKKELKIAQVKAYTNYAKAEKVHQQALKDCEINFGAEGRCFEMLVKLALNNYNFKGISEPARSDTLKKVNGKLMSIEIKTACGELATIINGQFKISSERTTAEYRNNCFDTAKVRNKATTADYVVYIPEPDFEFPVEYQAYVLTGTDFEYMLKTLGLIRFKQSTNGKNQGYDFYDRFAIQSFKNSKKKYEALYEMLEDLGTSLDLWIEENEIN